jgi:hypothetical protein
MHWGDYHSVQATYYARVGMEGNDDGRKSERDSGQLLTHGHGQEVLPTYLPMVHSPLFPLPSTLLFARLKRKCHEVAWRLATVLYIYS